MKKFILTLGVAMTLSMNMHAQDPAMGQLPLNPQVKSGVLPNGLSYYIMHNEEPKDRANFYIAQKVGSTLEAPDQLGLAHFLEHMAFNGTKNYPGKDMLNYLQSKGIRFGADINAYTAFDETVYNINNVITTDQNLMDSVLLVLHDWSGDILLEESEIDAERGVIQEEWRMRNNAQIRMYSNVLPKIYDEYQYQQMPIGKMDVVMNFKPEVLRAYYKKWYRPDLQGIVIVGDFDADKMEQKVIELFSTIEMPENAAERSYPSVSDNVAPKYISYTDPELTNMMTTISFKSEKMPVELINTLPGYIQRKIMYPLISQMINNRLNETAQTPDCRYSYAAVNFGDFWVSKTKATFDVRVLAKDNSKDAVEDALSVVTRACKTGFNHSEFERASQELMAGMEKRYGEKDKTSNNDLGNLLCRYFIDNEPMPGIETEYQIWQALLPQLPLAEINKQIQNLLTDDNIVIVTSAPEGEGFELASEEAMVSSIRQVMQAEYEALEEEKITDPLISSLPEKGNVVSREFNNNLQSEVIKLSNGVEVVVKPTDFSGDEILVYAFRKGGKELYGVDQAPDVLMMEDVYATAKLGNFDQKTLKKYLAGKNIELNFALNPYSDVLRGKSTVKDLQTLFELIYTSFTELKEDKETFDIEINRFRPQLINAEKNPQTIFGRELTKSRYTDSQLMQNVSIETLDAMNYQNTFNLVKNVLNNPSEFTFVFVGNIPEDTFEPCLEQYLASIPTLPAAKLDCKSDIRTPEGNVINEFEVKMETPTTMVFNVYSQGDMPFTIENKLMVELIGDILGNIYIETLREEEGGTYSPSTAGQYNPQAKQWNIMYMFATNADQKDKLMQRANDEWISLLNNGADNAHFQKAKEAKIKQYEINVRKNNYWINLLNTQLTYPEADVINNYENVLKGITLDKFNDFMKNFYDGKNRIEVIMQGMAK